MEMAVAFIGFLALAIRTEPLRFSGVILYLQAVARFYRIPFGDNFRRCAVATVTIVDRVGASIIFSSAMLPRTMNMKRVTGIGGIFFKAKDPKALGAWYRDHLGLDVTDWGGAIFEWGGPDSEKGMTVWSLSKSDATHLGPGAAGFMINYRVADLQALLAVLRSEGCNVEDRTDESEHGKFGWVFDPEGNKVELWEAPTE